MISEERLLKVLLAPNISEKSTMAAEANNTVVFKVATTATKAEIKAAVEKLFEVSVVSVPCNQGATFSLAKSFDNMEEYKKFQNQFIKANSGAAADAVKIEQPSGEQSHNMETKMSEEKKTPEAGFDLESFAKEVAEKTATTIAMKQAEAKAAEEKNFKRAG